MSSSAFIILKFYELVFPSMIYLFLTGGTEKGDKYLLSSIYLFKRLQTRESKVANLKLNSWFGAGKWDI